MHRFLTLAVVLFGLVQASPVIALVDEARVAVAREAADELLRRAEGSATTGTMPRRTDPAVAKLLDTVFDASVLQPTPISKIGPIGELARNGNRIGLAYILAGTGRTDTTGADRALLEQIDRNTATFAPEVGQFTDFQMATTATMAGSALDFIASATPAVLDQPKVKAGLGQMRAGFAQTIGGMLKTLTISGIDTDWKLRRLAALDGIADTAARFLGSSEKASLKLLGQQIATMVEADLAPRVSAFTERASGAAP